MVDLRRREEERETETETLRRRSRGGGRERKRTPRGKFSHEEGNVQMPSRRPIHCNFVLVAESSPKEKDLERAKYCNCVITRRKSCNACYMQEILMRYPTIFCDAKITCNKSTLLHELSMINFYFVLKNNNVTLKS